MPCTLSVPQGSNATVVVDAVVGHALVVIGGTALGVVLAPVVAAGVLGILGFGAAGVIAGQRLALSLYLMDRKLIFRIPYVGSYAAAVQSGIGNVAAGSLFALLQSIGAGGALPAVFSAISGAIGALLGAIIPF